jgi:tetratricopeptide (TPR) repeat protein
VRHLRKAAELKPSFLEAHVTLGMVLKEAGELDEAIAAFEAALQCQPLSAPTHAQLGEVLLKRGRTDEAVAHLKQAVELNPNDTASWKLLHGVKR